MLRFTCVVLLVVASVSCIPIESESSKAGLVRPSPINPDVFGEPLPDEASTTTSTQASRETHIQKIPARGTKLSATLDQDKSSTTSAPKEKRETETVATIPAKSNFRRDQPTTTSSHKQSGVSTTTAEPVSLKTPIVHPSGLKVRRSADDATTSKPTTTTRGPLPTSGSSSSSNSNNDDDNSGPHFIRPVPVDQILKNLHEAAPQHHGAAHHEEAKQVEATTSASSSDGTTVNDHKFHRKTKTTTTTEAPEEPEEQEQEQGDSHEDDKDKDKESSEDSKQ